MKTTFDYIVIGAGSAGSVLAARLTEDAAVTVALVEAGDSDNALEINVPLLFPHLFKTQFDWDFTSEPEPALEQRRIYLPRGKVLGVAARCIPWLIAASRQRRKKAMFAMTISMDLVSSA